MDGNRGKRSAHLRRRCAALLSLWCCDSALPRFALHSKSMRLGTFLVHMYGFMCSAPPFFCPASSGLPAGLKADFGLPPLKLPPFARKHTDFIS